MKKKGIAHKILLIIDSTSMTNLPAPLSKPSVTRFDNSWLAVALVAVVLMSVVAAVFYLWLQLAPQVSFESKRYYPIPHGAALTYRMTNADGSITYHSRNVFQGGANTLVSSLDVNSFSALLQAAGIDLGKVTTAYALSRLSTIVFVEINDIESDAHGKLKTQTKTRGIVLNDQLVQFSVNDIGIAPPIPFLPTAETPQTFEGKLNEQIPYHFTQQIDQRGAHSTALGEFSDCVRVRSELTVNNNVTQSQTWYCAGVGEVADETTDTSGTRRSEIVAANVGDYVRGGTPILPDLNTNGSLQRVFYDALQAPLSRSLDYKERIDSQGITTNVLPVGNLLLYGTQSGALVALDRAGEKEQWRFQTGAAIYSTPVVANGIAYFGSADKKVYAVRVSDGAYVWAFPTHDIVSAAPAVDANTVYFASEDRSIYAVDADTGRLRWKFSSGSPFVASPVVQDGLVFVSNDDGGLFALSQATGELVWSFAAGSAITAAVTIEKGVIYFGSYDQNVYALDEKKGALLWSHLVADYVKVPVIVQGGRVFATLPEEIFALDANTGVPVWHYANDRTLIGAPLLLGEQLWILGTGNMLALDANTGAVTQQVPTTETGVYTGLSGDGHEIYVGFFDGQLLGFVGGTK